MQLGPLLRAHSFLQVQQPPQLWAVDVEDEPLIRLLGELIAVSLTTGAELGEVILRVNNVVVTDDGDPTDDGDRTDDEDADEDAGGPPAGEYVALTLVGAPAAISPAMWSPAHPGVLVNPDVAAAARTAGVVWGYVTGDEGRHSVTVFLPRLVVGQPEAG